MCCLRRTMPLSMSAMQGLSNWTESTQENCESSNVTGLNIKRDQLGQDTLARTGPAISAMVLPQRQFSVLKWFKTICI